MIVSSPCCAHWFDHYSDQETAFSCHSPDYSVDSAEWTDSKVWHQARILSSVCLFNIKDNTGNNSPVVLLHRLEHHHQQLQQLPRRPDGVLVWESGYHGLHGLFQFLWLYPGALAAHAANLRPHLHGRAAPTPTDGAQGRTHSRSWRNNLIVDHIAFDPAEGGARCQIAGHHCRFVCSMLASASHHQLFQLPVWGLPALAYLGDEHCHHPLPC